MNSIEKEVFHKASIAGRYIYGYYCLMSVIQTLQLEQVPKPLDDTLKEFVETNRKDEWQDKIEVLLPSRILSNQSNNFSSENISVDLNKRIASYYLQQPEVVRSVIEELIWLGMSNLYGKFDSDVTFAYIVGIVELLEAEQINLPSVEILKSYPVTERKGWGNLQTFPAITRGL